MQQYVILTVILSIFFQSAVQNVAANVLRLSRKAAENIWRASSKSKQIDHDVPAGPGLQRRHFFSADTV